MSKKHKFAVGDWVIHDYDIAQIKRMEDDRVTEISTGHFAGSGYDLDVRPLTLQSKVIAESFQYYREQIQKLPGQNGLNWPDIHRKLVELCYKTIDEKPKKDAHGDWIKMKGFEEAEAFIDGIRQVLDKDLVVEGVRILRA